MARPPYQPHTSEIIPPAFTKRLATPVLLVPRFHNTYFTFPAPHPLQAQASVYRLLMMLSFYSLHLMIWLSIPIAFVCPLCFPHTQISGFFAFDIVFHTVLSYKNMSLVLSQSCMRLRFMSVSFGE